MSKLVPGATVFDTPSDIEKFRRITMASALRLEAIGMKHSRGSVAPLARKILGVKTKDKAKLAELLRESVFGKGGAK